MDIIEQNGMLNIPRSIQYKRCNWKCIFNHPIARKHNRKSATISSVMVFLNTKNVYNKLVVIKRTVSHSSRENENKILFFKKCF